MPQTEENQNSLFSFRDHCRPATRQTICIAYMFTSARKSSRNTAPRWRRGVLPEEDSTKTRPRHKSVVCRSAGARRQPHHGSGMRAAAAAGRQAVQHAPCWPRREQSQARRETRYGGRQRCQRPRYRCRRQQKAYSSSARPSSVVAPQSYFIAGDMNCPCPPQAKRQPRSASCPEADRKTGMRAGSREP